MMYRAQVMDTVDFSQEGKFQVFCPEISEDAFSVTYVSPYHSRDQGGIIAVPEVGVEVLISQAANDGETWYYIGSVVGTDTTDKPNSDSAEVLKDNPVMPEGNLMYEARYQPQRILIKSPGGHRVVLSDSYSPETTNRKIEIKSGYGKKILLSDAPNMGMIWIRNENLDGIQITSKECNTGFHPSQSILSRCKRYQKITSEEGSIDLDVIDGNEINITNTSTGANVLLPERQSAGCINISSKSSDVNINARDVEGSVFIDAGEHLQLECRDGTLYIHSQGNIQMTSDKDITLDAGGDIKMNAGAGVDIQSTLDLNLQSLTFITIPGNVMATPYVSQTPYVFNTGPATQSPSITTEPVKKNKYGD